MGYCILNRGQTRPAANFEASTHPRLGLSYLRHAQQGTVPFRGVHNATPNAKGITQQKYINCFMRSCVGLKAWRNLSNADAASVVLVAVSDAERSRPGS